MSEGKTIIEIQGVKMEVDLRSAKRVDEIRVGDRVRVLCKSSYGDDKVHHGIVIGFEPFASRPTVIVCYVESDYSDTKLKFVYFNAETKDYELIRSLDDDKLALNRGKLIAAFDRDIAKKQAEVTDIEQRKAYFLDKFDTYWEPVESAIADGLGESDTAN